MTHIQGRQNIETVSLHFKSYFKCKISDFEILKPLGKGNFATVFLAREKLMKYQVAIKVIRKAKLKTSEERDLLRTEIEIHSQLKHPNIIRLLGWFQDEKRVYIIMEYAPMGTLYHELTRVKRFDELQTAKYIAQLAEALKYCHSKHVIHRDIKLENILFGADGELKLSDFGLSVCSRRKQTLFCGTAAYLSPEMIEEKPYDKQIDTWALGVLCYELLVGEPPFKSLEEIKRVHFKFPSHVLKGGCDLISKLLRRIPSRRLSLDGVLAHPWIMMKTQEKE